MPFETKVDEELERELDTLKTHEVGSDGHKNVSDSVTRLMDRAIELRKVDADAKAQERAQENEKNLRLAQMKDERRDRIVRYILDGAKLALSVGTIWLLAAASFTYEEKGTLSSSIGKKVLGGIVPGIKL